MFKPKDVDIPRPPIPSDKMQDRLQRIDVAVAKAARHIAKSRKDIQSRRSPLFESLDPILLVLKLLPQELSNVHKCVKQALTWDFLTDESKARFEAELYATCKKINFDLPHLSMMENNEAVHPDHGMKLIYRASQENFEEFSDFVISHSAEEVKRKLSKDLAVEPELQQALQDVQQDLRNLTKIRIRYKRLLYEAMDNAVMRDESTRGSGVAMDVLLHPWWN